MKTDEEMAPREQCAKCSYSCWQNLNISCWKIQYFWILRALKNNDLEDMFCGMIMGNIKKIYNNNGKIILIFRKNFLFTGRRE